MNCNSVPPGKKFDFTAASRSMIQEQYSRPNNHSKNPPSDPSKNTNDCVQNPTSNGSDDLNQWTV